MLSMYLKFPYFINNRGSFPKLINSIFNTIDFYIYSSLLKIAANLMVSLFFIQNKIFVCENCVRKFPLYLLRSISINYFGKILLLLSVSKRTIPRVNGYDVCLNYFKIYLCPCN